MCIIVFMKWHYATKWQWCLMINSFLLQPHFVRHDTPHPKELRPKHPKFAKAKGIDGHVIPHAKVKDQVCSTYILRFHLRRIDTLGKNFFFFFFSFYERNNFCFFSCFFLFSLQESSLFLKENICFLFRVDPIW